MSEQFSVEQGAERTGVSRRTLLKGAAVVGGTVWVAPVIESFTNRAAAASGPANDTFACSYALLVYQDTNGGIFAVKYAQTNTPAGSCASLDTDGSYKGEIWQCGSIWYMIDQNNQINYSTDYNSVTGTGTWTLIPGGDCSNFLASGTSITYTGSGTWLFALIHGGPTSPDDGVCNPGAANVSVTFTCPS